jgi:hypothetical protein
MALRIGILANFQHESLAIALGAVLPDADIISADLNGVADDNAARAKLAASLAACDHLISHDVAPDYGPLSTRALRQTARNYHLMPALNFGGFHPDCVAVRLDRTRLGGPAGGLHSRIVAAGVLAGLPADEIIDLFNPLVFARLGYFDTLAQHSALLIEKFAAYAINLADDVAKWRAGGCFMTSPTHPKMRVFLDLARIACAMMRQSPGAAPPITSLRDPLAAFATMPFLPEIAASYGMQPEGVFRDALPARPLTLAEFVRGSVVALARAPHACLRAVQGVPEALARLDLRAAPRPPRVVIETPESRCLLSWQGTIVRIEAASSLIVHEALWPPSDECTDFILDPVPGPDGTARAAILGGLDLAPAPLAGTVTVSRQGRAMQAEAGCLAVPFKGEGKVQTEAFLALSVAETGYLREIMAQDWLVQGTVGQDGTGQDAAAQSTPHRVASARIRLRPGFMLDLATVTINLIEARPVPVPAGPDSASEEGGGEVGSGEVGSGEVGGRDEGGAGYRFTTPSGPVTLRPTGEPPRGREIALLPDKLRRLPNEAGSIPAFRTAMHASWSLAAQDEIAHPPLTAHNRDTAWVFDRCTWPGGLPSGLQLHHAALRRMPDRAVLLAPGLEGIVFDAAGTMTEAPALSLARGQALPPGLRQEEGALLIEADRLAAAPIIDEPVALCLSPGCLGPNARDPNWRDPNVRNRADPGTGWRNTDGWLIDVALRLHVMAPFLPRGARLLVPPGFAQAGAEAASGPLAMLAALGLNQCPVLEAPAALCRLADAVWLDNVALASTPASLLHGFRARIAALFPAPAGAPTRLYVKRTGARAIAPNEAFDSFLATQGFTTIVAEALPPAERIAQFRGAEMVIGAHGEGLADIVFCPDGARVLEISPRGQFRPRYWMLAEKCGLIHGVLPCATDGGGFDSVVQLDVVRLRNLYRALRLSTNK